MRGVRALRRVVLIVGALLAPAAAGAGGTVEGRVTLGIPGARLADVRPVVVYLEPVADAPPRAPRSAGVSTIRQRNARFTPGFLAVPVGETLDMPNDDEIYHNVFSYSKGNAFDLGLYAAGTSRQVRVAKPGPVKIYCSIHESMNATVFVAPTPHFATVAADGSFRLRDVPSGRWRLRTWCERLPDTSQGLVVPEGGVARVEVPLGAPPAIPSGPAAPPSP